MIFLTKSQSLKIGLRLKKIGFILNKKVRRKFYAAYRLSFVNIQRF